VIKRTGEAVRFVGVDRSLHTASERHYEGRNRTASDATGTP